MLTRRLMGLLTNLSPDRSPFLMFPDTVLLDQYTAGYGLDFLT
jgi:hypothetical protein